MSELTKRVAVAAVGIPAVLALLYVGGWILALPLAAFAALGAIEVYRFGAATGIEPFTWLGASGAAALVLAAAWRPGFQDFAPWALGVLGVTTALALAMTTFRRGPTNRPLPAAALTVFGALYAGLSLSVIPLLHALPGTRGWSAEAADPWAGLLVLALPLAATWVGDASAYFAGTAWGRRKLAPTISPNKSWVGFWGDVVGAGAAAGAWHVVAGPRLPGFEPGILACIGVGAALGVGAVFGDLAESVMKREAGVKDSGTFFPGHGGVLDRLDALIVTLPLTYVALAALGGGG